MHGMRGLCGSAVFGACGFMGGTIVKIRMLEIRMLKIRMLERR